MSGALVGRAAVEIAAALGLDAPAVAVPLPDGLWYKLGRWAPSRWALALGAQALDAGLPAPLYEVRFNPTTDHRFDLAWPALGWACEVDGGTWANGRHSRGGGHADDCTKLNLAACRGWRVLRVPTGWVLDSKGLPDGRALAWLERALAPGEEDR